MGRLHYAAILLLSVAGAEEQSPSSVRVGNTEHTTGGGRALPTRIVGGSLASDGEYPFYAVPETDRFASGLCGSVKIWDDVLLSAAHCFGSFEGNDIFIGGNRRTGEDALETIRAVSELQHPSYNSNTNENDFLLIKLQQKGSAPKVPWNTNSAFPEDGRAVVVIGYGHTSDGGNVSDDLLEVTLNMVDDATCRDTYGDDLFDATMMCAYKNSADSCQGDRYFLPPSFDIVDTVFICWHHSLRSHRPYVIFLL